MAQQESETKFFLYCLKLRPEYEDPDRWTGVDHQVIRTHARFLSDLGRQGKLLFAGRTLFDPGHPDLLGIAVVTAASLAEAEEMMAADPSVTGGIQRSRIFPYSLGIRHFENAEKWGLTE